VTIRYTGNGAYCDANSLYMALRESGAAPADLPEPGFLECLTTMPFGTLYLRTGRDLLVYFSSPLANPDQGLSTALDVLGWECRDEREGTPEAALARLAEAAARGPVLAGPLDMGALAYMPQHAQLSGSDHFVVVLGVEGDRVRVHDPDGYPYAAMPAAEFLRAWRAERVRYSQTPYAMRSAFRQARRPTREAMIARTLDAARASLAADPGGPDRYGGPRAFRLLASDLRGAVAKRLAGHLTYFALPLAARRSHDAAAFLREAGQPEAAGLLDRKARCFGEAQYWAVQERWADTADLMEGIADLEGALIQALGPGPE
jgi:Butirosin biosynthesis protein H, N-terminal